MFLEPTTLTSAALLITETAEKLYGVDSRPIMKELGMNPELMDTAGARYPTIRMLGLWAAMARETKDPCFGLAVGARVKTTTFHALGFAWLASSSVLEELERLRRYFKVICSMPIDLKLVAEDEVYRFEVRYPEGTPHGPGPATDAFFMAILKLCQLTSSSHLTPTRVGFQNTDREPNLAKYIEAFSAPVHVDAHCDFIEFDKADCEAVLPGKNIDLLIANERVLENYMQALDPNKVSTQVRELLISLMPSGHASQEDVAARMNRSLSTLQRQLSSEGTNFKEIRDETRQSMAEQYIEEGEYSLSQIAFLLGFSDQSNFSRAFKRWTGTTPGEYRPNQIQVQ